MMHKIPILAALLIAGSVQAQNAAQQQMNRAAQERLRQDIYHHHIRPGLQTPAQNGTNQGGVRVTGYYYFNDARHVAFAIGAQPHREERHRAGHRIIDSRAASYGTNAARGEPNLERVRHETLQRCADDANSRCRIIAEAGNSCVAVAEGFAHPSGNQINRYRADGELYRRFYVAHLSAEERGNPQSAVSDAQVTAWRQMLAARARQMCQADRAHPVHECQPLKEVWAMCGIDSVARGATGVYQ